MGSGGSRTTGSPQNSLATRVENASSPCTHQGRGLMHRSARPSRRSRELWRLRKIWQRCARSRRRQRRPLRRANVRQAHQGLRCWPTRGATTRCPPRQSSRNSVVCGAWCVNKSCKSTFHKSPSSLSEFERNRRASRSDASKLENVPCSCSACLFVATFWVARLTLQTPKLWLVATDRGARHACLRFFGPENATVCDPTE